MDSQITLQQQNASRVEKCIKELTSFKEIYEKEKEEYRKFRLPGGPKKPLRYDKQENDKWTHYKKNQLPILYDQQNKIKSILSTIAVIDPRIDEVEKQARFLNAKYEEECQSLNLSKLFETIIKDLTDTIDLVNAGDIGGSPEDRKLALKQMLDSSSSGGDTRKTNGRPGHENEASPRHRLPHAARELIEQVVFYTCEIGGHVFGSALVVLGMWFMEWLIEALWHEEPVLFYKAPFAFPLGWLFNLGDATLLSGFLVLTGSSLLLRLRQTHWRRHDGDEGRPSPSGRGNAGCYSGPDEVERADEVVR